MEPKDMTDQKDGAKNLLEAFNASLAESHVNLHQNDVVNSVTDSLDLMTQREKIQQQILALEKYFDVEDHSALSPGSSIDGESDDEDLDDDDEEEDGVLDNERCLDAKHEKIQREIKELEERLGLGAEDLLSDNGDCAEMAIPLKNEDYSDEEDLELPLNAETCLEMNLVYQEVVKEKLQELEQLLWKNNQQQREIQSQIPGCGGPSPSIPGSSSMKMFIGNFLKPYFKDKVTGLGPPANPEMKEKMLSRKKYCDEKNIKRWEGWQKSLLISAIVQDTMKRLLQPKLSKMEYLTDKMAKVEEAEKLTLQNQIKELDVEIARISKLSEDDLMGERNDDHDWEKISNIDFEGKRQAEDLKQFWQNYLHPSINKSPWKKEEIEKLKGIVEQDQGNNWEEIAAKMETNRTAFMCFQTHQRYICKDFRKRAWTKEEDEQLRDLVQKKRIGNFIPFTQISYFMGGRDNTQVIYRWSQVLDPSIKKGPWSKTEDELLLKAVEKHGVPHWWRIRYDVPGRTDAQCRERYMDCLSDDVKKGPWTKEEVDMLLRAIQKYGIGKWSKIASEIPYRTDSQCLNKWKVMSKYRSYKRNSSSTSYFMANSQPRGANSQGKRRVRKKACAVKAELEQSTDEEVPSTDSDAEEDCGEGPGGCPESEEEATPELIESRYVQPPLAKWLPKQMDTAVQTTGALRTFFVKPPNTMESDQSSSCTSLAHYTVLDHTGHPVKRIKTQLYDPSKRRTFDEELILVPEQDVQNLYPLPLRRPGVVKMSINGKQSTGDGSRQESEQGHSGTSAGTKKFPSDPALQRRGETRPQMCCQHELKAAISAWMGNILLPLPRFKKQKFEVDVLRGRAARIDLSSTAVFLLGLKILHIDTEGCKKVISARKNSVVPAGCRNPARKMAYINMGQRDQRRNGSQAPQQRQPQQALLLPQQPQQALLLPQQPQQALLLPQQPQQALLLPQQLQQALLLPQQLQQALLQQQQPQKALLMQQQPQKALLMQQQPQKAQPPQSQSQPQIAQQLHPSQDQPTQPQPGFTQMPHLLLSHSVQLAQPVLTPVIPPNSAGSPSSSNADSTRPSKRVRKPTTKAKELMKQAAEKAENQSRHKKPRLEEATQPVSPVTWVIAPSALAPVNTQNNSMTGNSLPPHASNMLPSPSTLASNTPQANIPLNVSSVYSRPIVFKLSDVPMSPPVVTIPAVTIPNLVSTSLPSAPVTTSSTSIPGSSAAPPATSHITACSLAPPVSSSAPLTVQSSSPIKASTASSSAVPVQLKEHPSLSTSARPIQTFTPVCIFPQPVVKPLPAENQNQPPLPDSSRFDQNLMFLEDLATVQDWMKGGNGIVVPQLGRSQPYLPPFVSNVNTLQCLLKAKMALFKRSSRVLPGSCGEVAGDGESEEQLEAIRRTVAERFRSNPAYWSLRARFLSCFTLPAFLATIDPAKAAYLDLMNQSQSDEDLIEPNEGDVN